MSGPYNFANKICIVTGGASGMGKDIALALVDAGVVVVVADINYEAAQTVASLIGISAIAEQLDVSDVSIFHSMANKSLDHIHVGENNRRLPGLGGSQINWQSFFDAIKKSGYEGYITLEPLVLMGSPLARKVNVWRDLTNRSLDNMLREARDSVQFTRNQLKIQN